MSIKSEIKEEGQAYYWLEVDNNNLKQQIKVWESRYEILEKMLLNVCRHTYMLKANQINVDQLFAVVNGCLTNEIIDRFTWDYLMDEESKKLQTHKKIQEVMKKYIHDYDDVEIKTDEIDESGSPVIITSQRDIYEGNLTQEDIEDAFKEEK